MQKFNPEKELQKIQNSGFRSTSTIKGLFIPVLVLACSFIAILSTSFSSSVVGVAPSYTISIEMINGPVDNYVRKVSNGPFSDTIDTDATFGSINCVEGNLNYDSITKTISSDDVRGNIKCIIAYINNGTKKISISTLDAVNDNSGTSYYYTSDRDDNYIVLNNTTFRIVRINGDGSYRLILNNSLKNSALNNALYESLSDWALQFNAPNVEVVKSAFDVANYTKYDIILENLITTMGEIYNYGGLLSVREAMLIYKNDSNNYLGNNMLLSNFSDLDSVWTINETGITPVDKNTVTNIYPVINVKLNNLKGQGTREMPYYVE